MNWSSLISRDTWAGIALEAAWKLAQRPKDQNVRSTWKLSGKELQQVQIFWPVVYEWPSASKWMESLITGFRRYLRVERAPVVQPYKGIVLIQMAIRGKRYPVAIDYSDLYHINEDCVRDCSIYFKMQFAREGYGTEHVLPGGFVPNSDEIYDYLPSLRRSSDRKSYRYDVYGRFGLEFARDIRHRACTLLGSQNYFRWEGGLRTKRYSLSLREIAHSKICVDLPGNGDFCFRLIDYFAIGACVIAPRHHTTLHVPLVDREHIAFVKDDLSDLIDVCRFYLNQDAARDALRLNSRSFFDTYLHRDQMAAYYLRSCLDRLY